MAAAYATVTITKLQRAGLRYRPRLLQEPPGGVDWMSARPGRVHAAIPKPGAAAACWPAQPMPAGQLRAYSRSRPASRQTDLLLICFPTLWPYLDANSQTTVSVSHSRPHASRIARKFGAEPQESNFPPVALLLPDYAELIEKPIPRPLWKAQNRPR